MLRFPPLGRLFITTLALALGLLAALLPAAPASANGAHIGSQEVFLGIVGRYDVRVLAVPVVGNLHLTIYVSHPAGVEAARDTRVELLAHGPDDAAKTVGPVAATGSVATWFSATLPVEEAGRWLVTLTVTGTQGEASVDFPVQVLAAGGVNWGILGALALAFGVATWLALARRRRKGRGGRQ